MSGPVSLGFFFGRLGISLIFLPLKAPAILGLGFEPVWFAVLLVITLQPRFCPAGGLLVVLPQSVSLFYLKVWLRPRSPRSTSTAAFVPFMILQIIATALMFAFPELVLWLPDQMYR